MKDKTYSPVRKKLIRRLLRWFIVAFIITALMLSAAFAYLYTHQDQMRGTLTEQINRNLEANVQVGDIRMDFFSRFPDVSFRFSDVFCPEVLPVNSTDTLFYFTDVYFEFNLWQLIRGNYKLKGISFDQGNVEIRMYEDGTVNYIFWKESPDTASSTLDLGLEDLRITRSRIQFEHHATGFSALLNADRLDLNGVLESGAFTADFQVEGLLEKVISDDIEWVDSEAVFARWDFITSGDSTHIRRGKFQLNGLIFGVDGWVTGGAQQWDLSGTGLLLSDFVEQMPERFIPDKSLVDADGTFDMDLRFDLTDKLTLITANTRMDAGKIILQQSGLALNDLSFDGHFDNGTRGKLQDATLRLEQISAKTRTGTLTADLSIRNFNSPTVATAGHLAMDFNEALTLAKTDFWDVASGRLEGNFNIRKRYGAFADIQKEGLANATMTGSMTLNNGRLKVSGTGLDMTGLEAALDLNAPDITLHKLAFKTKNSDFEAKGTIKQAVVFDRTPTPTFNLNLKSGQINLEDILAWELSHNQSESTAESFKFNYIVNFQIDAFSHRGFNAAGVQGRAQSDGGDIVVTNLGFDAADGHVAGRFRWSPKGGVSTLSTTGTMREVDIHQLFEEFDDFGQKSLTADNIYGEADVDFDLSIAFDAGMKPVISTLKSETSFRISQGRLVDYAPLEELSYFAEVNELRDVSFATLENHLSIENRNIHIPGMNVKSSILELWIQGDHGFDDQIDYSLKLQLLDALGKRRTTSPELRELIEESNRPQPLIPVRIVGDLSKPSITLDRSLLRQGIRDDWKEQGEQLRELIKKDTGTEVKEEPEYIFEWNE